MFAAMSNGGSFLWFANFFAKKVMNTKWILTPIIPTSDFNHSKKISIV